MPRPGPVRALGVLAAGALLAGLGGCAWSAVHSKLGTTTTVDKHAGRRGRVGR